jgi:hypothetical protein
MLGGGAELLTRRPRADRHVQRAGLTTWGAWGALVAKRGVWSPSACGPAGSPGKSGGLWQCYRASESALPMRI